MTRDAALGPVEPIEPVAGRGGEQADQSNEKTDDQGYSHFIAFRSQLTTFYSLDLSS
jgi:hypothetical protein